MNPVLNDKDFVEQSVFSKIVYNDLISVNQNNTRQIKSKFKLCISLSSIADMIIDGKIFGVSATKLDWHDSVECVLVDSHNYSRCYSRTLFEETSAYTADKMEVLSYEEIRSKIENTDNGFIQAARVRNSKYSEIISIFDKYFETESNPVESVATIKRLANEAEQINPDVLRSIGIDI